MVQPSDRMPASPTQLSVWPVAIGGVIGILVGLFLGDYAHLIRPVGEVYVLLLEVAVYPYLICSLLHGLGSMAPAQAWRLFRSGWKFYVALWGITFGLLILLAHGIPQASSISLVADAAEKGSPGLLEILIPSDPFTALSRNYVPAVVLFCLFYGATQRLARACGIEDPDTGEIVRTNISVAYPLGQLGNFFVYLFIVFALFFNGVVAQPFELWLLPVVTLLSCVGSPTSSVDAVTFLAGWLGLPNQTTSLYVSLMTLTRYGQVIASVAGFAFLSFGVVLAYYGKIRVRWSRLLFYLTVAVIMVGGFVLTARRVEDAWVLNRASNPYFPLNSILSSRSPSTICFTTLDSADPLAQGLSRDCRSQCWANYVRAIALAAAHPELIAVAPSDVVGYHVTYAYRRIFHAAQR